MKEDFFLLQGISSIECHALHMIPAVSKPLGLRGAGPLSVVTTEEGPSCSLKDGSGNGTLLFRWFHSSGR